ncbi:MAG: NifB/NifX family molybdenum-iron cluster-binding protein [Candidatus Zixiibacteriota bacterium]
MRIAMPTDDRKTLAGHFGRAAEFAIYEADKGEARLVEYRPNHHVHAGHGEGQGAGAGQGAGGRGSGFEEGLAGVEVLICRGMGRRAQEVCASMGIRVMYAQDDGLDDVASRFARGELAGGEPSCDCGSGHQH